MTEHFKVTPYLFRVTTEHFRVTPDLFTVMMEHFKVIPYLFTVTTEHFKVTPYLFTVTTKHFKVMPELFLVARLHFVAHRSHYARYLCQCVHSSQKRITRIVGPIHIVEHQFAMIYPHREAGRLLFEDAYQINEVSAAFEVRCFHEIAICSYFGTAQVHKMGARSKATGHCRHIVVHT